eukprot:772980-Rhodomonas_salina.2
MHSGVRFAQRCSLQVGDSAQRCSFPVGNGAHWCQLSEGGFRPWWARTPRVLCSAHVRQPEKERARETVHWRGGGGGGGEEAERRRRGGAEERRRGGRGGREEEERRRRGGQQKHGQSQLTGSQLATQVLCDVRY